MAGNYFGVLVSDPWLQNQFTQVELRSLKSYVSMLIGVNEMLRSCKIGSLWNFIASYFFLVEKSKFLVWWCALLLVFLLDDQFLTMRRESGSLTLGDLPSKMSKLKNVGENLTEEERAAFLHDSYQNLGDEVDFELFLRVNNYTNNTYLLTYISVVVF